MEGWRRGRGFKREAKMDWKRKVEMERRARGVRRGERERGNKMGPVVVETSATGAAEMERDA